MIGICTHPLSDIQGVVESALGLHACESPLNGDVAFEIAYHVDFTTQICSRHLTPEGAPFEVLDRSVGEGETPFAELVRHSGQSRVRVFAEHSPFDMKDNLKARGYRWSDGSDGRPKAWWIEVDDEALHEELHYLRSEADPSVQHLTPFDRFKAYSG